MDDSHIQLQTSICAQVLLFLRYRIPEEPIVRLDPLPFVFKEMSVHQAVSSTKCRPSASSFIKTKRTIDIAPTGNDPLSHRAGIAQTLPSLVHSSPPFPSLDHGPVSSTIRTISREDTQHIRALLSEKSPRASRSIFVPHDEQAKRPRMAQWGNRIRDPRSHDV